MEYLLFTYPNCPKCEKMKALLAAGGIAYAEHGLTTPGGKAKIREFINHIRRDETGMVKLPTLICHTQGIVRAVLTSAEDYEAWSKSRG